MAQSVPDIILDNNASSGVTITGSWTTSTNQAGFYGSNYIHDGATGKGSKSVRFTPNVVTAGYYEVYVRWTSGTNRSTNVPLTIQTATGTVAQTINQTTLGQQWVSFGIHPFHSGTGGNILISNTGTAANTYVIVDAVRLVYRPTPWTPANLVDQIWLDWRAEDLPNGAVASWASRVGGVTATQSTAAKQPVKQNGEVTFGNAQLLNFPRQDLAHSQHRGLMILFRIDLTGSGDGAIFSVNGVGGGAERQPMVSYNRGTNTVGVSWRTSNGYNGISFPVVENATQWHCLVSRRVGDVHYASLDGKKADGTPGESQVVMADWALPKVNIPVVGNIGDFRSSTPTIGLDTVLVIHDELSQSDAEKLMGWGMWRRGAQAQLPSTHPYRNAAPLATPPTYVFAESTTAQYNSLLTFWQDTTQSEQFKGTVLNTAGWSLVFEDQFDQHTVTNEASGRGNWFAPTHPAACGAATAVVPPRNSTDPTLGTTGTPATYIHSGSEMTIRMQNSSGWKSGAFCSVNSNGFGRAWMYPYVEVRMKTAPSTTGNLKGAWPAVWLKSINYFFNNYESNMEYDIYEGYISDNDGFHNSYHNWPAYRLVPGRLATHRWTSNYLGLKTPGWHQNVNLFDGQYHTYGAMVTPDWVINMFDGREMFRFPTPIEMKQPLWLLLDLAMHTGEVSQASGVYDLTIDYVKVYQNPAYPTE